MLLCVAFLSAGVYGFKNRSKFFEKVEKVNKKRDINRQDILTSVSNSAVKLLRKAGISTDMEAFDRKLFLAGRPFSMSAEEYAGAWISLIAAAVVVAIILALSGLLQPIFALLLVGLAVFLPHLIIDSAAESGQQKLGTEVINLILRLEMGTSAGLSPVRVLEWAAEGDSMMAVLLKSIAKEVSMGKLTYVVFNRLSEQYGIPEAREVAVSLKQAEVQGLPITQTLSGLSRDLRDSREREAEIQMVRMRPSIEGILTATMMVAAITLMVGPLAAENLHVINHMMEASSGYTQ